MISAGLPGLNRVIPKFLLLNPDRCFGKEIDAAEVVPVSVADDHVGDFFGWDTSKLHGFVGADVFRGGKVFEESLAVIAAVKENVATTAPNEPDDHGDIYFFAFGRTHNEACNFIFG